MGGSVPKQFMELCGKPVLVHTLEAFLNAVPDARIVIALPEDGTERWKDICIRYSIEGTHKCCKGGDNRFGSVRNALSCLPECDIVLVHDGVRPLVDAGTIFTVTETARDKGSAVPVIKPVDSFRLLEANGNSVHFDRDRLRAVQTPQGFRYGILKKAYGQPFDESFTDDASVVGKAGFDITLCDGAAENIKITSPSDIMTAETFLRGRSKGI